MKIVITESQYKLLSEAAFKKPPEFEKVKEVIDKCLKEIYDPLGKWGKIQDGDCQTNTGVIGVFPHSDTDPWSILNRFNTNSLVHGKIKEIYLSEGDEQLKTQKLESFKNKNFDDYISWIKTNKEKLFGEQGEFTKDLINLNKSTIEKGQQSESFAEKILKGLYEDKGGKIVKFCAGHVSDTTKGQDIKLIIGGKEYYFQVKGTTGIDILEDEGRILFKVDTSSSISNYSENNVDFFFFVKGEEYVIFENLKRNIIIHGNNVFFIKPPVNTNMDLGKTPQELKWYKQAKKIERMKSRTSLFADDPNKDNKLKQLLRQKEFIDRQIQQLQDQMSKK